MYEFTSRAKKALELASTIAVELGHKFVGTEHLLYGLSKEGSGVASKVLENQNVDPQNILAKIEELVGKEENQNLRRSRVYTKNKKSDRKFI